ncbi:hypothetical protein C0993_001895 [Termitomyces sp. T159_Od127]|nr:hypothetical protein C0993_001895 [Termitomyces sp. T159_Od127]
MEAAALMLIHILTPRGLSWTRNGIPDTDAAHDRIKDQKQRARPEDLCRNLPEEFEEFLRYCRSLSFAEQPDYARWIETFRDLKVDSGYEDTEDFVWPPPAPRIKQPTPPPAYTSRLIRGPVVEPDMMRGILEDLKRLEFNQAGDNKVLRDRTNVEAARRQDSTGTNEVIEISSGSEEGETKASRLTRLTGRASSATDNAVLGELVRHFIQALKCNSSRTLTKEASAFLNALHKQLEDPSVFVAPQRRLNEKTLNIMVGNGMNVGTRTRGWVNLLRWAWGE